MGYEQCVKQTYAKLYYIPPKDAKPMADCKLAKVTKLPELRLFTGQISALEGSGRGDQIGIRLICSVVSSEGAGGIILLLQVSGYIEWELEFVPAHPPQNTPRAVFPPSPLAPPNSGPAPWVTAPNSPAPLPPVRETHRVFVSLPMLYKIEGPKVLLLALSFRAGMLFNAPVPMLTIYAAKILNVYRKLREVDNVLHRVNYDVVTAQRGFCPDDVRTLQTTLANLEKWLSGKILEVWSTGGDDKNIAGFMRGRGDGAGRFLGDRLA